MTAPLDRSEFGTRVWQLRTQRGWTQLRLAVECGHQDRQVVTLWETGRQYPRVPTLCLLADALDTTVDYLLGRQEQQP